ncbi:MAG: hypothetical protein EBT92_19135 [Planctomycetes bacterium]|nr:hypothetical protein [Planctomycetota bacterium]
MFTANTINKVNEAKGQRLSITEKRVLKALLKASKETTIKHHYECDLKKAFKSLRISRFSFGGAISSLKGKGIYNHIIWSTNPNKTGYKDYPAKCVRVYGEILRIRSDIALVVDPVFFESRG